MRLKSAGLGVLRWVLWLLVALVLVRGVASFLLPGGQTGKAAPAAAAPKVQPDPAGLQGVPVLFAREYLTWEPGGADDHARRIAPYLARNVGNQAGWAIGKDGAGQTVDGAWLYGIKPMADGRWLVTVAVRTLPFQDTPNVVETKDAKGQTTTSTQGTVRKPLPAAMLYLAMPVGKTQTGGLSVYDVPALVPAPQPGDLAGPVFPGDEATDQDGKVKTLVTEFFRGYIGGNDVSYFLEPGIKLPKGQLAFSFVAVTNVTLLKNGDSRTAVAELQLTDPTTGARFTTHYHLSLTERDGRWYIKDLLQKGE